MIEALKTKSLRFWITLSMTLSLLPLALSSVIGYIALDRCVIVPIHDVAQRQRDQVARNQHVRLMIWDSLIPFDEAVSDAAAFDTDAYNVRRDRIEQGFIELEMAVYASHAALAQVRNAAATWRESVATVDEYLVRPDSLTAGERTTLIRSFHASTLKATGELRALSDDVSEVVERDYRAAIACYEWAAWLAVAAGLLSLGAIGASIRVISHVIANSVDQLVAGATLFANGDRDHRIHVEVPPELRRVANEFNGMIERIHVSEDELAELAYHDALTGLANRRVLNEHFAALGPGGNALMIVDIDRFKTINDTYGHGNGDIVLKALAETMAASLGPADSAYRVGGEEFVILTRKSDATAAAALAEGLRKRVAASPVIIEGAAVSLTISIGVAAVTDAFKTTMEAADAALYRAKTEGRNCVRVAGA